MKIKNIEFNIDNYAYAQKNNGAVEFLKQEEKTSLFTMISIPLRIVPQDKTNDLDYVIRANEIIKKISSAKVFDEVEFSESEFNLIKSTADKMNMTVVCDGIIEFKKFFRDLKYEKSE